MIKDKARKETEVMVKISSLFDSIEDESVIRIIQWINSAYDTSALAKKGDDQLALFDLPAFFSEKKPKTDKERVLLVSYWFQFREGHTHIDAVDINKALGNMNFKSQNITRAYHLLQQHEPPLVVKTSKSSPKKQGRKFYEVTIEGKRFVEEM